MDSNEFQKKVQELRREKILSNIAEAQTVEIANFEPPGGMVVRKVLRGDATVGEHWNESTLPTKSVLIYHKFMIGDISGTIAKTGYYELNSSGQNDLSKKEGGPISIEEVTQFLKKYYTN
ncbi:hypothetical protein JIN85_05150 [Luteolibacter pohnpeiensis]|uniref:Uncharacterized protein n=1 Tax=Luteolibacter pohnpeiensis TaxID=454153 RepID=A0A934S5Z1_9BACT|nr:hypothetical protein [Luteolibacter pohnpeiensis]MBK1881789.1 hypothetical protein [Luteolibacter pohnpeiensis]